MRRSRWAPRKASSESSPQNLRDRAIKLAHNSHMYSPCNLRKLVLQPKEASAGIASNYLLGHPEDQPVYGNRELVRKEVIHVEESSALPRLLTLPIDSRCAKSNRDTASSRVESCDSALRISKYLNDVSPSASTVEGLDSVEVGD
ncbi:hypothetical protein Pmar_PMAR000408 [Perkinsus marinus ATCC 50983]|uniref:Uncharacterized protein n=1 Tax=Perkinsus marinus (strain ATCC 50983 / TXsc) TaxID=423536 RepID=C5L4D2_PERM5|nr:hypothetical protein Pmar_PMAR000408 [Perkinsus marinus ATCC 50983]EER08369.1 hypothetical protein Pmar_PMAR000408 [Perkinsus marinus ATCC 50983]|eukprot:XP_002776553.1 hypothetical protein Pmar_PMAR000408 [Perkinsus marinus ATCC 50983]